MSKPNIRSVFLNWGNTGRINPHQNAPKTTKGDKRCCVVGTMEQFNIIFLKEYNIPYSNPIEFPDSIVRVAYPHALGTKEEAFQFMFLLECTLMANSTQQGLISIPHFEIISKKN